MIATSFVFILLIAVVSGKSILEMFFGPTVSSESENVCANNSCTCTVNGVCKNDVGTSSSPLGTFIRLYFHLFYQFLYDYLFFYYK